MAMLAESKKPKKYVILNDKKALYEDENRFGTKMLKMMGWSKDKGLGLKEDGSKDFVRFPFKSDVRGIGFEDRDDQWTSHEDNFNNLLQNLNDGHEIGKTKSKCQVEQVDIAISADKNIEKLKTKLSGESLEDKSKSSKVRVHYKKFTRGKDLKNYSEKDLANIFGKKIANDSNDSQRIEFENSKLEHLADFEMKSALSVNEYFQQKRKNGIKDKEICADREHSTEIPEGKAQKPHKKRKRICNEETLFEGNCNKDGISKDHCAVPESVSTQNCISMSKNSCEDMKCTQDVNDTKERRKNRKSSYKKETPLDQNFSIDRVSSPKNLSEGKYKDEKPVEDVNKIETSHKNFERVDRNLISKNKEIRVEKSDSDECSEGTKLVHDYTETKRPRQEIQAKKSDRINNLQDSNNVIKSDGNAETFNGLKSDSEKQPLKKEELFDKQSINSYIISSFIAEKFSQTELGRFYGSNMPEIVGYSLNENVKVEIRQVHKEDERIYSLWSCTLDKYLQQPIPKYMQYVKDVIGARRAKVKPRKFHVKSWKRKNLFQSI